MLVQLLYLVAASLFILGLKRMSHPRTAVLGNLLGAFGMGLAILLAIIEAYRLSAGEGVNHAFVFAGLVIGAAIGAFIAYTVKMTGMPQMVALLNGLGGLASVLIAAAELIHHGPRQIDVLVATAACGLIGAVTFCGSLMAYGKLEEFDFLKKPWQYPHQQLVNIILAFATLLLSLIMVALGANGYWFWAVIVFFWMVTVASALGILLVNPIGGADMPVVISLLNSYSGLAGAATGFVIHNSVLIISGSLVGASGIILTQIMCKAMNRSIVNVLFGIGAGASTGPAASEVYAKVRSTTADDVALLLDGAQRVVIVPGYGMAVAQAQHAVRELAKLLEDRGTNVEFAIHPVAGRMPGHMNVLLAEADISYDKLQEMDAINPTLDTVDVAIVIGANDVVNPVARTDPQSPIAGMPIIDVDKCRTVVVIKRSLSPGFAGIPNPLFADDNTLMLYADAKDAVLDIAKALKAG
ncbi:MAG TPA: NAD(P)(+) transhydrogenase (Re/Si-specific) subunit beta [Pirellulaceae bacterium]|nr:NAD(P)(+) transhydrogenase (Re/Si-specific) subunit beta [Pirellulaceae bacterium]